MRRDPHEDLVMQCRALGLPLPEREYRFHATRRWRFDWAWPALRLALEQEGVVYATEPGDHRLGGRHTSATGFAADLEKYRAAFILGWRVLRILPSQIADGTAMFAIEAVFTTSPGVPTHDTPTVPLTSHPSIAPTKAARRRRAGRAADRRAWTGALDRAAAGRGDRDRR